eukprot:13598039-Alexandrium_andersonii.AAC.1
MHRGVGALPWSMLWRDTDCDFASAASCRAMPKAEDSESVLRPLLEHCSSAVETRQGGAISRPGYCRG